MKKTICFALTLMLACVLALSACDNGTGNQTDNDNNSQHQHNYSLDWSKNNDTHWNQCSCGNKINVEEHDYNSGVVTLQPTESTKGIKTYTCLTCGKEKATEIPALENTSGNQPSHEHVFASRSRVGSTWKYTCSCGQSYSENIDFFQEIVDYVKANGKYSNYTYECMVGSDVSNGYTYNRYVSYDSINQELCFTLTFGQYMRLEIYMTEISREYNYYFEDRESHCFIRGIIDTNQCVSSYYCFTDDDNIENTNVTGALLYDFAEIVQSQVKLFIVCFNNDYAETDITAQDFCFPILN